MVRIKPPYFAFQSILKKGDNMKPKSITLLFWATLLFGAIIISACDKDDDDDKPTSTITEFVSLESPYLICANRNPGGVGFDFEYNGKKGGANNLDSLTVPDFAYDAKIRTIKGEKPDGTLGGAPYIQLYATVEAVNYSKIDTTCTGFTSFTNLNIDNIQEYTLSTDNISFDLASVQTGATGNPMMQALSQELNKLIIGQKWKPCANNSIANDEPIWLIKTREGKLVKLIVTKFPAYPAPTSTGYISIEWSFVE